MDFAPYQSSPPEHGRIASPEYASATSPRASQDARRPFSPPSFPTSTNAARSPPPLQHPQPHRGWGGFDGQANGWNGAGGGNDNGGSGNNNNNYSDSYHDGGNGGGGGGGGGVAMPGAYPAAELSEFDTSLGLRLDYEACLAYLAFPPVGAIILLILERNSDYVRFHAWQSALLFSAVMFLHLLFSWSGFLSWLIFFGDIGLIAFLTMRAYKDAEILDRFEVPFFGRIASRFLDDE